MAPLLRRLSPGGDGPFSRPLRARHDRDRVAPRPRRRTGPGGDRRRPRGGARRRGARGHPEAGARHALGGPGRRGAPPPSVAPRGGAGERLLLAPRPRLLVGGVRRRGVPPSPPSRNPVSVSLRGPVAPRRGGLLGVRRHAGKSAVPRVDGPRRPSALARPSRRRLREEARGTLLDRRRAARPRGRPGPVDSGARAGLRGARLPARRPLPGQGVARRDALGRGPFGPRRRPARDRRGPPPLPEPRRRGFSPASPRSSRASRSGVGSLPRSSSAS